MVWEVPLKAEVIIRAASCITNKVFLQGNMQKEKHTHPSKPAKLDLGNLWKICVCQSGATI